MTWLETISNIVREVTKKLPNVTIKGPLILPDKCFSDKYSTDMFGDEGTFIVDSLGAFSCKPCHQERLCSNKDCSGILVCRDKVKSYAEKYNIPEDVLAIYVFLHELCHLIVHVHLPDEYRKTKIPNMLNLEEPFCEFVALQALEEGIFKLFNVGFRIVKAGESVLRDLHIKLRRPLPYKLYMKHYTLPYKIGVITNMEYEILQLYKLFSRKEAQELYDLLCDNIIFYLARKLRKLTYHNIKPINVPHGCTHYDIVVAQCTR